MNDAQSTDRNDRTDAAATQDKVIVLGWQVVVLPVLIVAVVVGGFLVGRAMSGPEPASSAQPIAAAGPGALAQAAPQSPGGSVVVDPATGQQVIQLQPSDLSGALGQGAVIDLGRPSHPLLDQPAPEISMNLLGTDQTVTLSGLAGKPVMVNFWATWCPPCRNEMPWFENVYNAYKDAGLVVLAVNAGEKVPEERAQATVQAFVDMMGLTFPVLFGDLASSLQLQQQYSVMGLPATFFVDPSGKVTDLHTGMFPNQATLDAKVRRLMGLDEPTPTAQP